MYDKCVDCLINDYSINIGCSMKIKKLNKKLKIMKMNRSNRWQKQSYGLVLPSVRNLSRSVLLSIGMTTAGLSVLGLPISVHSASLNDLFAEPAASSSGKFLPVEQAFKIMPSIQGNQVSVYIDITSGHYVYRDKIKLSLPDGVTATPLQFDQSAHFVDDPTFGKVAVFDQNSVTATASLTNTLDKRLTDVPVIINWQGCAKAGLCYPPEQTKFVISLNANIANSSSNQDKKTTKDTEQTNQQNNANSKPQAEQNVKSSKTTESTKSNNSNALNTVAIVDDAQSANNDNQTNNNQIQTTTASTDLQADNPENQLLPDIANDITTQDIAMDNFASASDLNVENAVSDSNENTHVNSHVSTNDNDPFGLASHPVLALLLIFLAGLTLAFTPCVLPMLPIVANIVAQQKQVSQRRSVVLSGSYALGVAVAYGLLGAVIAYFGQALGILGWLQNPVILGGFALVFIVLALYMLDVVSIRLPSRISQPLQQLSQAGNQRLGSVSGSFLVGLLSALVVSPCVSAPLYGSLLAVATIGSVPLGFAALFLLGLGLSLPLVVLAATGGKLMPKAGEWMAWVKEGLAYLLFAVALLLIERILQSPMMLLLWALWFAVVAFWWHKWSEKAPLLSRAMHYVMLLWAGCLIVGAALGAKDSLHPLQPLQTSAMPSLLTSEQTPATAGMIAHANLNQSHVTTLAQLDSLLNQYPKVLVDVTADWCIECRIMEKTLFSQPPQAMAGWHLVHLDVTETTEESKAILQRYQLFGPPSLLYYVNGNLQEKQIGEIKRDTFTQTLAKY